MRPITIVGGGLAGLTLGIGLRRQSVPTTIWEMGQYPRHRVCGEFISGKGQETLRRLGLVDLLIKAGARQAETVAFFSTRKCFPVRVLPQPALCLGRIQLDALLAEQFVALGGELRCGARWSQAEFGDGIVRANGRRLQAVVEGWHWFGLKAHAQNLALEADLEMHLSANSYVGLCRLEAGRANVCGLFRRRKGEPDAAQSIAERLRGESGSVLQQRLESAQFDESSLCAVGGLSLSPRRAARGKECCIGDSLTMIAPVTGNGMSMAFEAAEMAVPAMVAYARGEIEWEAAREAVAQRCDAAFRFRLWWAKRLQEALFCAPLQAHFLPWALKWKEGWRFLFWATR